MGLDGADDPPDSWKEPDISSWRDRIDLSFGNWGRRVVRHRRLVVGVCVLHLVAMASQLPNLRFENSSKGYLLDDDPILATYEEFCDRFGQDDQIVVALTPGDVFAPDFLAWLRDLHVALENGLPWVTEVNSLVNARNTRGEGDLLIVEDLLADWPSTPEAFVALRARAMANPLYIDALISRDGRTTTISIEPDLYETDEDEDPLADLAAGFDDVAAPSGRPELLSEESKAEILDALDAVLERHARADVEMHVTGGPVVERHVDTMMMADIRAYMGVSATAIALFLYALFRRVSGVLLPALVVVTSLVSTLGTMVWIDVPLSLPLGMLPIFTMTVSVCTVVHVLVAVYREVDRDSSIEDAVAYALHHSGLAISMASITTAAGLFSFVAAELAPIRDLGTVAPFAVVYAFVFTVTLVPALMAMLPPRRRRVRESSTASVPVSERLLVALGALSVRHARGVLVGAVAVVGLLWAGATRLEFSHQPLAWFPLSDPIREAVEHVDRVMRGSTNVEVVIDTQAENGLHDPAVLRRIEASMAMAEGVVVESVFVGKALSLVDIVKESHEALNGGLPEARVIPDERAVVSQELLLFENAGSDDLEKFTDSRFSLARLSLRLPDAGAVVYERFLEVLDAGLAETLGALDHQVTGRTMISARSMTVLITSMASSYLIALVVITPLMILMIGDLRLGLISMVPNLIPVLFVLGTMGWTGVPLDASNIMIGSIIIGLAVDDTIHFLQRFRREFDETGDVETAVRETMRVTGAALFFTSLVLSTGFAVMASQASMLNTIRFGVFCAAGIAFAFLLDVIVTPALITLARRLLRAPQQHAEEPA